MKKTSKNREKTIEECGKKSRWALRFWNLLIKSYYYWNNYFKNRLKLQIGYDLRRIPEQEQKVDGNEMIYKRYKSAFYFYIYDTIWTFGDDIKNDTIPMDISKDEQNQLKKQIKIYQRIW